MLEETRRNIGISLTRIFSRAIKEKPVQFSNAFSSARTALVIVPENQHHRAIALSTLTLLQNKFQGNRMTIVTNESFRDLSTTFTRSTIVPVKKEQLNFFFLPKRSIFERILTQKFDVLVDLNFSLVPTAAYFCRNVNANLKVGFAQEHADAYYNFQFNSSPNRNPKSRYEQLFRTLSMF